MNGFASGEVSALARVALQQAQLAEQVMQSRTPAAPCPLCLEDGGVLVAELDACRVVRAGEPGFPASYRVVLTDHVAEWSDVHIADQLEVMRVVNVVETTLRANIFTLPKSTWPRWATWWHMCTGMWWPGSTGTAISPPPSGPGLSGLLTPPTWPCSRN
jgi:hypothetical protein